MLLTDNEIEFGEMCRSLWSEITSKPITQREIEFARAIEAAILAKLGAMELPEPAMKTFTLGPMFTTEQMNARFAQGAAAQLAERPTCWITPDGEGFRIRLSPPVDAVPLGWQELYTRKEAK
jgi:hypothetical protein